MSTLRLAGLLVYLNFLGKVPSYVKVIDACLHHETVSLKWWPKKNFIVKRAID